MNINFVKYKLICKMTDKSKFSFLIPCNEKDGGVTETSIEKGRDGNLALKHFTK